MLRGQRQINRMEQPRSPWWSSEELLGWSGDKVAAFIYLDRVLLVPWGLLPL